MLVGKAGWGTEQEALRAAAALGGGAEAAEALVFPGYVEDADLPILYLTGFSDHLFTERQVLWEGEAFLDKPCTPRGLLEAVSLVRSTSSSAGDVAP